MDRETYRVHNTWVYCLYWLPDMPWTLAKSAAIFFQFLGNCIALLLKKTNIADKKERKSLKSYHIGIY
jgi:hypothetical protein